jgi:hypothetical protein
VPIVALSILAVTPAAKSLVQIEAAIAVDIAAVAHLQIAQPVTHDVDESGNGSTQHAGSDENKPYLARIRNLLDVT